MVSALDRKEKARRKLLRIMPRSVLEDMSGHPRPYMQTHAQLVDQSLARWDADEIKAQIEVLLRAAS
jgi:hypothetical protein